MKKKVVFLTVFVVIIIVIGFYFVPKTAVYCGSALPVQCKESMCEKGFIYNPSPIGGNDAKCLFGDEPKVIDTYLLSE